MFQRNQRVMRDGNGGQKTPKYTKYRCEITKGIKNKKLWENFNNKKVFEKNVRKRYTLRLLVSSNYFYISEKPKDLLYDIRIIKADKEHPRPPHSLPAGHKQCDSTPVI